MNATPVLNVFAVRYQEAFIATVKAALDVGDGASQYLELTRQELLKRVEDGAELTAIDLTTERKVLLGKISLVDGADAQYFSLNNEVVELDDLGDLQQY